MKFFRIVIFVLLSLMSLSALSQVNSQEENQYCITKAVILGEDTVPYFSLPVYYCYPQLKFKNKKQENFYWRTVYDIKMVLPYLKHIRSVIDQTNKDLITLPDKSARDDYMKNFEKRIYQANEAKFKELSLNQGKLIIKLLDRETNNTSYELIKAYRGSFSAGFWQVFAKLLGADLKSQFGLREEDAIIERIIILVEAGQL